MPTYTILSGAVNELHSDSGGSVVWADMVNGTGTASVTSAGGGSGRINWGYTPSGKDAFAIIRQVFHKFDCSSVPVTDTVTSVVLQTTQVVVNGTASTVDCFADNWSDTFTIAEWCNAAKIAGLTKLASLTTASATAGVNSWTSVGTNFNAAINKGAGAAAVRAMLIQRTAESTTVPGAGSGQQYTYTPTLTGRPQLVITTTAAPTQKYGWGLIR